jgi:cation diffusion facilitator family transporter
MTAAMSDASEPAARKSRAALASVAASTLLTIAKLGAGALTGSLALTSEGVHNAVDIVVSATTYFAVREADKPADEDHQFGHAKIEAVAALAQTGFLFVLALGVVYQAVWRLAEPGRKFEANIFAFAAIVVSIAVDIVRWRTLARIARETGSDALAADALHFSSDLVASFLVLIGLALSRVGFSQGDALAAIGVAGFIGYAGFVLGRRTIDSLVDAAPKGFAARVRLFVESEPGIDGVDYVRLRRSGAKVVGDLGVFVSRTLPFEQVALIKLALSDRLVNRWPDLALTVIANPLALDDETILERVLMIAARRRLFVHHVAVQRVEGRPSVTLDLEVDGRLTLAAAHAIASRLEDAIRSELGEGMEVETHIEPLELRELAGRDADAEDVTKLAQTIRRLASRSGKLVDIHDVRLRIAEGGRYAIFHCQAPREMSLQDAHEAVDALERAVRRESPDLIRVIGHAEPLSEQR